MAGCYRAMEVRSSTWSSITLSFYYIVVSSIRAEISFMVRTLCYRGMFVIILSRSWPDSRSAYRAGRKVRAPQGTVPGNAWEARAYGKCRRK